MSSDVSFDQAVKITMRHVRERGLDKSNTSRSLAISLALEAGELLEYYQWRESPIGSKQDLESELADVLIYAIQFAHKNSIDIPEVIKRKIEKQDKKYPIEIFSIKDEAERNRRFLEAKLNYKKDTTL